MVWAGVRGWSAKSSIYLALILIDGMFSQVVTLRTRPQREWLGADAVLLQETAEAEQLAVGGGELLFEVS